METGNGKAYKWRVIFLHKTLNLQQNIAIKNDLFDSDK